MIWVRTVDSKTLVNRVEYLSVAVTFHHDIILQSFVYMCDSWSTVLRLNNSCTGFSHMTLMQHRFVLPLSSFGVQEKMYAFLMCDEKHEDTSLRVSENEPN